MAHTEEMLIHGAMTPVTVFDSSAQEIDDAAQRSKYAGNPNLLDNWYFPDPINQRGQTSYVGNGYGIDRWSIGSAKAVVSVGDNGVTLDNTSGTDGSWYRQPINLDITGEMVTISLLLADGTFYSASGVVSDVATVRSPNIALSSGYFYVSGESIASGYRAINITAPAGTAKTLVAVKLELGSVQTLAHQDADGNWILNDPPPNKALELAKCQRYFRSLRGDRTGEYASFGMGVANSATQANVFIPDGIQMRITPAITSTGSLRLSVNGGASYVAVTGITSGGQESAGMSRISVTVASGLTQGDVVVLQADSDATADIRFDANL